MESAEGSTQVGNALTPNIRLGLKWMTLTYIAEELITALQYFVVPAPRLTLTKLLTVTLPPMVVLCVTYRKIQKKLHSSKITNRYSDGGTGNKDKW